MELFSYVHAAVLLHGTTGTHEEGHGLDSLKCQKAEFKATVAVEIEEKTLERREPQKEEIYILHINSPQTLMGHLHCVHVGKSPGNPEESKTSHMRKKKL